MLAAGCAAGEVPEFAGFGGTEAAEDEDEDDSFGSEDADSAVSSISATVGNSTSSGTTGPQSATELEETGQPPSTGSTGGSSTGIGSTEDPAGTSSSSGAVQTCGDDMVDGTDECDGADLAEMTCAEAMPAAPFGVLGCNDDCTFDTSACVAAPDPVTMCSSPGLAIPDNAAAVSDTLVIARMDSATDVDIHIELTHTFIGDLTVNIVHGADDVRVFDRSCSLQQDIDADFDDEAGAVIDCPNSAAGNAHQPANPLSAFDADDSSGNWQIVVQDNAAADTGTLTMWCVTVSYD